jgi:hypothetical protein
MISQKEPENVKYLNYLGRMVTGDARWTRGIKCSIAMAKAAGSSHQQTGITCKEEPSKVLHLEFSFVWC